MSHLTSILSRSVLCGAIAACILDSAAAVALRRRGTETDRDDYYHERGHSKTVMFGVLAILLTFLVISAIVWRSSCWTKKPVARHTWENLEKQSDMPQNEKATFQNVDLTEPTEPEPAVQSTRKRSTDTWDKYLSMIKSPSRLNSTVGKMSTMNNKT